LLLKEVFIPFWAFDAEAESDWSASAGYRYNETETYTDDEGNSQTRSVSKTRWKPAHGEHKQSYQDWLVSAGSGLEQEWVSQIVPFDLTQATTYSPDYMAGWGAEAYSKDPENARQTGEVVGKAPVSKLKIAVAIAIALAAIGGIVAVAALKQ
jgi:hypothetical protein